MRQVKGWGLNQNPTYKIGGVLYCIQNEKENMEKNELYIIRKG